MLKWKDAVIIGMKKIKDSVCLQIAQRVEEDMGRGIRGQVYAREMHRGRRRGAIHLERVMY